MSDLLNEIKEALENANPRFFQEYAKCYPNDPNAAIFANAPQWLASLVSQVEEKQTKLRDTENEVQLIQNELINAKYKLEEMENTLEKIATTDVPYAPITDHSVMKWYEQIARQTLQSLKEAQA